MFRGGLMYRLTDTLIGAAAADMASEGFVNIGIGGRGILGEQRGSGHDHAGLAVATLRDLIREPDLLHGMLAVSRKPFDGGDAASGDGGDARGAGARGLTIQVYGASAAKSLATAEFCAGEPQGVTEDPEQRGIWRNFHGMLPAVYRDRNWVHVILLAARSVKRNSTFSAREMQFVFGDRGTSDAKITVSPDGAEKGKIKLTDRMHKELS
jgi:hypothetical protein